MPFTRRALLATLGGVFPALAGCLGGGDAPATATVSPTAAPRTTTRTPTATPAEPVTRSLGESYETAAGWAVTVGNAAVRKAVVELGGAHYDPVYADGQYVVTDVTVEGDGAPDLSGANVFVRTDALDRSERRYVADERNADHARNADRVRRRFAFPVPISPAPAEGAVVWRSEARPAVRWTLPADLLAAVARPPAFDLRGFEVRDVSGEEIGVTLTIANTGSGDGTFLAEVGDAAVSDQPEVSVDVPAGETVTATRRVSAFGDRDELTVVLRWRDERLERTVRRD